MTPEQIKQVPTMPADDGERLQVQWNLLHAIKFSTEEQISINKVQDVKIVRINARSITAIFLAAVAVVGIAYYVQGFTGAGIAGVTQAAAIVAMKLLKII